MRVAVCDMLEGKVPCPEALWLVTMRFNSHNIKTADGSSDLHFDFVTVAPVKE